MQQLESPQSLYEEIKESYNSALVIVRELKAGQPSINHAKEETDSG